MNLDKIYYTAEGEECNILKLVKLEPDWAANRIQEGNKATKNIKRLNNFFLEWQKHQITDRELCKAVESVLADSIAQPTLADLNKQFLEE
jgi:hypothetical protein